jgi:ubiquinone/menaquinone biosynthesis C-methylase UbiE
MNDARRVPALLHHRLTPAYDLFARAFLREGRLKRELIARARIRPDHRVLDLGAGTGTLAIMVKEAHPAADVTGLDGDPAILAIARDKAARAGVDVTFDAGDATTLPYLDESFDRILSSLVMSLLTIEQKRLAVAEAHRVLRRGGEIVIGDFGPPHTRWGRFVTPLIRRFEPIRGNLEGRLPSLLREGGFEQVGEAGHIVTLFGTLSIVCGSRPA